MAGQRDGRAPGSTPSWVAVLTVVVVATYLALLGWDQHKDRDPVTAVESGPYQPWQVIACGAVLALLAFEGGRRGRAGLVVLVVPVVLTVCFAVDAATGPDGGGPWPVGAVLVALGSLLGTAVVAALGARVGRSRAARAAGSAVG